MNSRTRYKIKRKSFRVALCVLLSMLCLSTLLPMRVSAGTTTKKDLNEKKIEAKKAYKKYLKKHQKDIAEYNILYLDTDGMPYLVTGVTFKGGSFVIELDIFEHRNGKVKKIASVSTRGSGFPISYKRGCLVFKGMDPHADGKYYIKNHTLVGKGVFDEGYGEKMKYRTFTYSAKNKKNGGMKLGKKLSSRDYEKYTDRLYEGTDILELIPNNHINRDKII